MDWDAIRNELAKAVQQAFDDFRIGLHDGQLYALCLSVADDGMGIGLNANTESFFKENLLEESAVEEMTSQDEGYFRWSSAEWEFEGIGDSIFQPVNDALTQAVLNDTLKGSSFEKLIDAMIGALRLLREMQGDALKGVTLFVTLTDSDEAEEIENRSVIAINPPNVAQAFISRFG